jgi:hypothetical protein
VELKAVNNSLFGEIVATRTNVPMALEDFSAALPDPKEFSRERPAQSADQTHKFDEHCLLRLGGV